MNDDLSGGADLEGLDDPNVLAEIEAEFAELTAEIDRISALPTSRSPEKAALLKGLREQWQKKSTEHGDRPEWRARIDDTISEAVGKILEDGLQETADGKLAFQLQGDSLTTHGQPVLTALLGGFQGYLAERFPAPSAAPKPAADDGEAKPDAAATTDETDKAATEAAANPLGGLMSGIGQLFAQAIQNVDFSGVNPSAKADVKTTVSEEGKTEASADVAAETTVNLQTGVGFDTAKGDKAPVALQNLFKGLGAALNQTLQGVGAAAKEAMANMQAPAATPTPTPKAAQTDTEAGADVETAVQTDPNASNDPQEAAAPAAETAPKAAGTKTDAAPKPTLNIDFAGLFGQLLRNVKPATPAKPATPVTPTTPASKPPEADLTPNATEDHE
ncbi:MAG: hypothetical protein ACI9MR_002651 [Myxococcota bacterium]|jgi:hypothetical protein